MDWRAEPRRPAAHGRGENYCIPFMTGARVGPGSLDHRQPAMRCPLFNGTSPRDARISLRSRVPPHDAPSPVYGGRSGWGRLAVAFSTVLCYRSMPPSQPPPAAQGEGFRAHAHEAPSPVYEGRLGWGRLAVAASTAIRYRSMPPSQPPPAAQGEGFRAHAHEAPSPVHGGRSGWGRLAVAFSTVLCYRSMPPLRAVRACIRATRGDEGA
jgi:hypothetical protein